MSNARKTLGQLPGVFRLLLVLGVIAFISFLFPNHIRFKYDFEKGQRWNYDDLEAPFDFAIRKTEETLAEERQKLDQEFSPFYEVDPTVVKTQTTAFEEGFAQQIDMVKQSGQFRDVLLNPNKYKAYGQQFLLRIYDRGVINLQESHSDKSEQFVVNLVNGNSTRQATLEYLLTARSAQELLRDSLPYSRLAEPEFLYPLLENAIQPNIQFNASLTQKELERVLANVSTSQGMVRKGELIVPKGGIVTGNIYQKLISFRDQYREEVTADRSDIGVFAGYFILTSLIVGVFMFYLYLFAKPIFQRSMKLIFILMWLVVYSYLVFVVEKADVLSAYMIPFCIVPIVIKTFYNERLALFTHIVVVLIASFLSSLGYEFTFLQILAGIVVLLSDVDTRDWSRFFRSMLYIFLTYALAYFGLSLIEEGKISTIDWSVYTWIFLNVFLTLLAYPLIPLLERFFGFTSSISLVELSDMNRPLLRQLSLKAPGTFQHSLQVANMAEVAARRINADPLLVKVAALYHDIGKTQNPNYFIENQSGKNPHEELTFLESAKIIIGHVTEGVKMAKKQRLPAVLVKFIETHHGTTRAEYFYRSYLKEHPEKEIDESLFRYPGPKPNTKEETILMLADSIEAACKSLKNPTGQELDAFIDKIIAGKITQGQLDDSQMSFQELEYCKEEFKGIMRSVHHVRIEYPEEKTAPKEE
ncbi:MAG: HDIG domain-containing metalloprotein [Bacteroidota bacterium]